MVLVHTPVHLSGTSTTLLLIFLLTGFSFPLQKPEKLVLSEALTDERLLKYRKDDVLSAVWRNDKQMTYSIQYVHSGYTWHRIYYLPHIILDINPSCMALQRLVLNPLHYSRLSFPACTNRASFNHQGNGRLLSPWKEPIYMARRRSWLKHTMSCDPHIFIWHVVPNKVWLHPAPCLWIMLKSTHTALQKIKSMLERSRACSVRKLLGFWDTCWC